MGLDFGGYEGFDAIGDIMLTLFLLFLIGIIVILVGLIKGLHKNKLFYVFPGIVFLYGLFWLGKFFGLFR